MKKYNIKNTSNGWFIGNFDKAILRTKDFEANLKRFKKGDITDKHFHKIATEINLLISGEAKANKEICVEGDIIIVEPNEILQWDFLTDSILVTIKIPSVPNDKYLVEDK